MVILKIRCHYCGGSWEVYRHNMKDEYANRCPQCFSSIERATWDKNIIPSFEAVEESVMQISRDGMGYRNPMFDVSVIGETIFKNARCSRIEDDQGE